jgi:NADPH:quinone reductase-like Zn-dependent oxidoreductase
VEVIDASSTDVAARVRDLTGGKGAEIVYNTVGSPYFEATHKALAVLGRQILIATIERTVPFNILEFYRGRHTYVGVDTLALTSHDCAGYLDELAPGFEAGKLKAFSVEGGVYGFKDANRAYAEVLGSTRPRVVLVPDA